MVIATLTGDNGLLQKATTAKEANEEAKELELIKLAVSAAQVAGEGKLNTTNLKNELEKNLNDNDIDNNLKPIANYWNYKGYKINSDGNVEKLLLPKDYQQVEYIESRGTQWIDTEFYQKDNFILTCEAMFTQRISDNPNSLFSNESLDISLYSNGKMSNKSESPNIIIGEWQKFRIGMGSSSPYKKFLACNENIRNYESSYGANEQWCIFNHTLYKTYASAARLKEFTLTDFSGNTILMRGIPALDKNNEPCIYDIISKNVFYNSGTGTFGYETEDGTYVAPTNN